MKRLAILLVLIGCGGDDGDTAGIHSITTCPNGTPNAGNPCERGCATLHDETAIGCSAQTTDGTDVSCAGTFGLDGLIGCCVVLPDTIVLRFAECQ